MFNVFHLFILFWVCTLTVLQCCATTTYSAVNLALRTTKSCQLNWIFNEVKLNAHPQVGWLIPTRNNFLYVLKIWIPKIWSVLIYIREKEPSHLTVNFEFRTGLAGRCLCSQNINIYKYSNKPAKWLGFISGSNI